jgi:hypothetical protein
LTRKPANGLEQRYDGFKMSSQFMPIPGRRRLPSPRSVSGLPVASATGRIGGKTRNLNDEAGLRPGLNGPRPTMERI